MKLPTPLVNQPKSFLFFLAALVLVGIVSRVVPLFDEGGRLLQQFPTEDGYLMLTISRNMAIGDGMTTSAGTIPTNGVQPLTTFLWAGAYYLVDGNKVSAIAIIHVLQILIGILAAYLVFLMGQKALTNRPAANEIALTLAALFFASPILVPHTMNFLETGCYLLIIAAVALLFIETDKEAQRPWSIKKCVGVGFLLGLAFWARNDAVFLILAACLGYLFRGLKLGREQLIQRFLRTLVFGSVSVIVAAPWMISNYLRFGHIMPVSGQSEGIASFAQNLHALPSVLLEYFMLVLPIPSTLQSTAPFIAISLVLLGVIAFIAITCWRHANKTERSLFFFALVYISGLSVFYGLFFGATHFMSRYLAPAAPFFGLLSLVVIIHLWRNWRPRLPAPATWLAIPVAAIAICAALNIRTYQIAIPHQHFQVVNWIKDNVPEQTWVGAIQTGTLGYFHDRTINLDGKVNPYALEANKNKRLQEYVMETDIQYIADWHGIAKWADIPPVKGNFDLVVNDAEIDLAVLKRHGAPNK